MTPMLLLIAQAAAPAPPPPPPPPPWAVRTRTSSEGIVTTSASATGRDGSSRLVVKCDRGTEAVVSVQFLARQPLQNAGDDGEFPSKPVGLRFDVGAANSYDWQFRANAAFTSNAEVVTSLTLQLAKARQIKAETTNAAGFRVEALFDGPASDAPIRAVLQACGYVLGQVPAATPVPAK